jgi:hypothetical protein
VTGVNRQAEDTDGGGVGVDDDAADAQMGIPEPVERPQKTSFVIGNELLNSLSRKFKWRVLKWQREISSHFLGPEPASGFPGGRARPGKSFNVTFEQFGTGAEKLAEMESAELTVPEGMPCDSALLVAHDAIVGNSILVMNSRHQVLEFD